MNIKYLACVLGAAGLFFAAVQAYQCGQSATCSVTALDIDAGPTLQINGTDVPVSGPSRGSDTFTIFTGAVPAPPPPPPPRRSH